MNDIIVLDNREFLIINEIYLNKNKYLYVIATDGTNDFTILNEYEENGKKMVKSVVDEKIIEEVLKLFVEENK